MVKIEALIRPFKLDEVKAALEQIGVQYISACEVREGGMGAYRSVYRGSEYQVESPGIKIEILSASDRTDEIVEILSGAARTRQKGDNGMILVYGISDAIQIQTGAHVLA